MWWISVTAVLSTVLSLLAPSVTGGAQTIPTCDYFQFQEQAQAVLEASNAEPATLDSNEDGIACPDLPSAGTNPAMPALPPDGDFDCVDFAYQEMAQSVLDDDSTDPHNLDPNLDGFACALLPSPPTAGEMAATNAEPVAARPGRQSPDRDGSSASGRTRRSSNLGSREDPLPVGTEADIGDGWFVSVVDVDFDATAAILAENMFNEPPEPGQRFVLITISATYEGSDTSAVMFAGNSFNLVGASDVAYQTFDPSCGVIPNDFPTTEVFQGGTLTGAICFAVDSQDVPTLVMYSQEFLSFDSDRRVWYALQ